MCCFFFGLERKIQYVNLLERCVARATCESDRIYSFLLDTRLRDKNASDRPRETRRSFLRRILRFHDSFRAHGRRGTAKGFLPSGGSRICNISLDYAAASRATRRARDEDCLPPWWCIRFFSNERKRKEGKGKNGNWLSATNVRHRRDLLFPRKYLIFELLVKRRFPFYECTSNKERSGLPFRSCCRAGLQKCVFLINRADVSHFRCTGKRF